MIEQEQKGNSEQMRVGYEYHVLQYSILKESCINEAAVGRYRREEGRKEVNRRIQTCIQFYLIPSSIQTGLSYK
jgi:hypothetical protein